MKQILVLFSLLFLCSTLTAQKAEKHISYYSNQNIKEEGYYLDRQKDGVWKGYFLNGKIQYESSYENGNRNGPFKYYSLENGVHYLNSEGSYKNGKQHGKFQTYNKNGDINKTTFYENGKLVPSNNYGDSPESSSPAISSPAKSQTVEIYYRMHIKNNCHETVNLLLRYKTIQGTWITKGWNTIKPGEETYIEDTKNSVVYYYATDQSNGSWSGDETRTFNGKSYGFRKYTFTGDLGKKTITLNCASKKKEYENKVAKKEVEYRLYFKNKTSKTVNTIIRYQSTSGSWVTKGWYTIKAGQEIFIDRMKSKMILYHAKSNSAFWKGTEYRDFKGKRYGFKKMTFSKDGEKKVLELIQR